MHVLQIVQDSRSAFQFLGMPECFSVILYQFTGMERGLQDLKKKMKVKKINYITSLSTFKFLSAIIFSICT